MANIEDLDAFEFENPASQSPFEGQMAGNTRPTDRLSFELEWDEDIESGDQDGPLESFDGEARLSGTSLGFVDEDNETRIAIFKMVHHR
jgi:hypothetical protein